MKSYRQKSRADPKTKSFTMMVFDIEYNIRYINNT